MFSEANDCACAADGVDDGETPYLHFLVTQRSGKDLCAILQEEANKVVNAEGHVVDRKDIASAYMAFGGAHRVIQTLGERKSTLRSSAATGS